MYIDADSIIKAASLVGTVGADLEHVAGLIGVRR